MGPHGFDKQERALAEHFDRQARKGLMAGFADDERAKLRRMLSAWAIEPGQRIFEPGCGSGRLTEVLADAVGPEGEVYATDLSAEMVRRAEARRLPSQAVVEVASVHAVDRPDAHFDQTICLHALPHFENLRHALSEIARTLKPGGHLWVHHFKGREQVNAIHREAEAAVRRHLIPNEGAMLRLLEEAGFRLESLSDSPEGYSLHAVRG